MSAISKMYNDCSNKLELYLEAHKGFLISCALNFAFGTTVTLIASGGNLVAGVAGGAIFTGANIVSKCAQQALQMLRDKWCDHNQQPRKPFTRGERLIIWTAGIIGYGTGLAAIGVPLYLTHTLAICIILNLAVYIKNKL